MDQPKSSRSSAKRDHPQERALDNSGQMLASGLPSNPLQSNSQNSMSPHLGPRRASSGSSPTLSINLPAAPKRRRVPIKERKRTAMSCDRCKSHKIKCVDPDPGPCLYCATSGQECKITIVRKQRPFYYASEEQFRWLQVIASKLNPDADLNDVAQLQEIARALEEGEIDKHSRPQHLDTNTDDEGNDGDITETQQDDEQEEGIEGVVKGVGKLMLDPMGRQKYIGESASVAFHHKLRYYVKTHGCRASNRIFNEEFPEIHHPASSPALLNPDEGPHPLGLTPSGYASSTFSHSPVTLRTHLPPRYLANPLIDRFFKQVHSIFWVFPKDQFFRRLEITYLIYDYEQSGGHLVNITDADRMEVEEPSWMCCLFTVLALGFSEEDLDVNDLFSPREFFSHAKRLASMAVEDESIQSIQALLLMSLYLSNTDIRSLGWVFLGNAIRVAQLLGLHRNDATLQYPDVAEGEARRRLWWTLYEFERFSSIANGCPASIHDDDFDTDLPIDGHHSPGDYTPVGYLKCSVKLAQISGHIFKKMYSVPPQSSHKATGNRHIRRTIADLFGELVEWRHQVPSHLRIDSTGAAPVPNPAILRALAFLDLRFQYAIISVTLPLLFRLVSAVKDGDFESLSSESKSFITQYSDACAQSARSALQTLKLMHQNHLLNNVLWLDAFYILSTSMVLLLQYLRTSSNAEAYRVNECISILRHLQPRGIGRNVLNSLSDFATFLGLDYLPHQSPSRDNLQPLGENELRLYELFNMTPSSAATPEPGGPPSPEMGLGGGYISLGEGANDFAWMDQIIRMAAEYGLP